MSDSPVIEEIAAGELYRHIRSGNPPLILDVRNADEFASGRIQRFRAEPNRSFWNMS